MDRCNKAHSLVIEMIEKNKVNGSDKDSVLFQHHVMSLEWCHYDYQKVNKPFNFTDRKE